MSEKATKTRKNEEAKKTRKHIPRAPQLRVRITAEMIANAVPEDSRTCMIAQGVKAVFPSAKNLSVDLQTVRFSDPVKGLRYTYLTPRSAQLPLLQFDARMVPEPFEMRLALGHVSRCAKGHARKAPTGYAKRADAQRDNLKGRKRDLVASKGSVRIQGGRPPKAMKFTRRFGIREFTGGVPEPEVETND